MKIKSIKSIKSFAKINFSLNVIGKNKNNFHKIQSIYSFLKHHDEKQIQPIAKKKTYGNIYWPLF